MANEDEAPLFFLNTHPDELLPNVLRYFRSIPNARRWEAYMDLRDLSKVLSVRGGLGTTLKSRVQTLFISANKLRTRELFHKLFLWTDSLDVALDFFIAVFGES